MGSRGLAILAAVGCHSAAPHATVSIRAACVEPSYFDGATCRPRGDSHAQLVAGEQALSIPEVEVATAAIDAAEQAGPLVHDDHVTLWKLRGIAAAYVDDVVRARSAFSMLIALDPQHILSYETSPKATRVFEAVRNEAKQQGEPALDLNWAVGQKVGVPVPLSVTVLADPKQFIKRATLFVRTRGEDQWRSADLQLDAVGAESRLVLPAVAAAKSVSLELFVRAYDDRGNEVLRWADPTRPREIPLRFDPPKRWWQTWWGITALGSAAIVGTTAIVYAATRAPPDRVDGMLGTVSRIP